MQNAAAATAAKSLQLCLTLCDPIEGSPPGSPVPGILQARTLEWVAIAFSNARKWKVKVKSLSRAWLSATPWTADSQAPPSMGFSRQEYWSGLPLPSLYNPKPHLKNISHQVHIWTNNHIQPLTHTFPPKHLWFLLSQIYSIRNPMFITSLESHFL